MSERLRQLLEASRIDREERRLAGLVGAALNAVGGVSLVALGVLPGVAHRSAAVLVVLGLAALVWALASVRWVRWERTGSWLFHLACTTSLLTISAAIAASGAEHSPAKLDLIFLAVFVGYFFRSPVVWLYLAGCVAANASTLLYHASARHGSALVGLLFAASGYFALGGAMVAGKRRTNELRHRAERLAAEQGALRRVATAVVSGAEAAEIYELVGSEAARLLGAGAAGVLRLQSSEVAIVEGAWADHRGGRYEAGTEVPVRPGSEIEAVLRTGEAVRVRRHGPDSPVDRLGYTSSLLAPIRVAGVLWGVLAIAAAAEDHFTAQDEQRIVAFGDLLATAITSLEDRARLAAQAVSDPLTGLANHRELQRRLAAEVARSVRHGTPLAVAVIDIDYFKSINDLSGHDAGDETLVEVARCLARLSRAEDTVGRLGGDEFAWVLPETTRDQALVAVERARRMIGATIRRPGRITVSAGIADLETVPEVTDLLTCADSALYWSKANGRNRAWVYDQVAIGELSVDERADRLRRAQALFALRALAGAVDAKDPDMRRHSERVADLAGKLAREAGWSTARAQLLAEAGLVHDVGKLGVPDALLSKLGPLTPDEHEQIKPHAALAARIAEKVLNDEQVQWILTHHERPDGTGYPTGLSEEDIPEGGALLALAEAWDAMTRGRTHRLGRGSDDALRECIGLIGRQFTSRAVGALMRLHAAGDLSGEDPRAATPVA